jgi:CheY-like chemotaxis protein
MLHASLPSGIELSIDDPPRSAVVFAEGAQLQQVILNLCNNAAQAIDGAGGIALRVELQEFAQTRLLSHGELPPGRYVLLSVSDTGPGIDEATFGRLFEPFFTTRMAGSGLGLATVREIVHEHGGMMNVRSEPGAGSCFEAYLPCIPEAALDAEAEADERLPALSLGRGQTVLVIDEDRDQLLRSEEILAALGYEPVGFARLNDALRACRDAPSRFDMLVLGHRVPGAATLRFAAELHEAAPDLPLLLARSSAGDADAGALAAAGVSDVVHWPIIATDIAAALERCLAMQPLEAQARRPSLASHTEFLSDV